MNTEQLSWDLRDTSDRELLLGPIRSSIARDDKVSTMTLLESVKSNSLALLEMAGSTYLSQDRTVLDLLMDAYQYKKPGAWSIIGHKNVETIHEFVTNKITPLIYKNLIVSEAVNDHMIPSQKKVA